MPTIVDELVTVIGFKVDKSSEARAKRATEGLRTSLAGVAKTAKRVGLAVSAAFAGAAVAAAKLTTGFAETADQFAKDSKRLGLGVEALQELKFAAELSGASFGQVKVGLRTLSQGLIDATSKGTGPAADAFAELGISMEDPAVAGRDLEGVVELVADRFAGMEDGATKAAVAQKLFGRSGVELIPLLDAGSAGIAKMRQEAQDLGGVFSGEAAASAEQFNDDMLRFRTVMEGVRNEIAAELLPVISDVAKRILTWAKANRTLIATRAREFVSGMITAVERLAKAAGFLAENWRGFISVLALGKLLGAVRGIQDIARATTAAAAGASGLASGIGGLVRSFATVGPAAFAAGISLAAFFDDLVNGEERARKNAARDKARKDALTNATAVQRLAFGKLEEQIRLAGENFTGDTSGFEAKLQSVIGSTTGVTRQFGESVIRDVVSKRNAKRAAAPPAAPRGRGRGRGRGSRGPSVDDLINRPIGGGAGTAAAPPQVALTVNRFETDAPITVNVTGVPGTSAREVADTVTMSIKRELQATITKAAEAIQTREAR